MVDNAKSRQPAQNSLLNFVARGKTAIAEGQKKSPIKENDFTKETAEQCEEALPKTSSKGKQWKKITANENEHSSNTDVSNVCQSRLLEPASESSNEMVSNNYLFDLPTASQLDSSVLNQLPDDIRRDIMQHYEKHGLSVKEAHPAKESSDEEQRTEEDQPGPSNLNTVEDRSEASETPAALSADYGGIKQISDIDASFWAALPDDIKAELAKELEQPKQEPTSPSKCWKSLFKPARSPSKPTKLQKSPSKVGSKQGPKRKAKLAQDKVKLQQPTLGNMQSKPPQIAKEVRILIFGRLSTFANS